MNKNLNTIIGIELMCGAQGVEFRAPLKTSVKLTKVLSSIREVVPKIVEDRYLANDIEILRELVAGGKILDVTDFGSYMVCLQLASFSCKKKHVKQITHYTLHKRTIQNNTQKQ